LDFSLRFHQAEGFHQAFKTLFSLWTVNGPFLFSLGEKREMGGSKRTSHCKWLTTARAARRAHRCRDREVKSLGRINANDEAILRDQAEQPGFDTILPPGRFL
jgi:hypothetical protein